MIECPKFADSSQRGQCLSPGEKERSDLGKLRHAVNDKLGLNGV
jgi:hypothetical protein